MNFDKTPLAAHPSEDTASVDGDYSDPLDIGGTVSLTHLLALSDPIHLQYLRRNF